MDTMKRKKTHRAGRGLLYQRQRGQPFWQLLALQFADWTQDEPSPVRVVEAGAPGKTSPDVWNGCAYGAPGLSSGWSIV